MKPIIYIDRVSGKKETEKVYGHSAVKLLYGENWLSKMVGWPLMHLTGRWPLVSRIYGYCQTTPNSAKKIKPFISEYDVDASEFELPVDQFGSFNDFFIRKLKKTARPIASGENVAVIPADGRYWFFPDISEMDHFLVKEQQFNLAELLGDRSLASRYAKGSMVLGRLCPSDYHRFHFPCDCIPQHPRLINGCLYSVNPTAIKKNLQIFWQNKRVLNFLKTDRFGEVLFVEVGATNVGTIHQTCQPGHPYKKGDEKGYFNFGGSALVLLFEPGRIQFDADLLQATEEGFEMRCLMGQRLGVIHSSKVLTSAKM